MTIQSLGMIGGFATTGAGQRAADVDRTPRDASEQGRAVQAAERAEAAAGIGQTEEDAQTSERDADGRRLWEAPPQASSTTPASADTPPALSKDATGQRGNELDVVG
jgi:hypothetical protein